MDKKKKIRILTGVTAFLVLGCIYFLKNGPSGGGTVMTESFSDDISLDEDETKPAEETASADPSPKPAAIYVHICGEVKNPGVYVFDREPRVVEVVEKAGGLTRKARQDCVNMAQTVADGTQLVIEAAGRKSGGQDPEQSAPGRDGSGRVNINTASKEELMTLSGIGESKATQILSYRESNGKFSKIEEIMDIPGIKEGVFSKIKDFIIV